jgi:HEPN domain
MNSVFTVNSRRKNTSKRFWKNPARRFRKHNLVALMQLLVANYAILRSFRRGLDFLTRFAVATRYPGDWASKRQAAASMRWAKRVRAASRAILGLSAT